jgi:small subunit ribosomal protein S20
LVLSEHWNLNTEHSIKNITSAITGIKMPHTDSAWKRLRKTETRRKRNRTIAKQLKAKRKELTDALKGAEAGKKTETAAVVVKTLDRAAAKGYIHKNKAARLKSRLAKKLKAKSAA